MTLQISSITLSYFVHSTEDAKKLNQAVCRSLDLEESDLHTEVLEGHYGNKMEFVKAHLVGRHAQMIVERISVGLDGNSRSQLRDKLEISMDEHDALYLRFDRQSIVSTGSFALSDQEPVRVKIKPKFRAGGRGAMRSAYMEELKL